MIFHPHVNLRSTPEFAQIGINGILDAASFPGLGPRTPITRDRGAGIGR